jgi:hypothetical protein
VAVTLTVNGLRPVGQRLLSASESSAAVRDRPENPNGALVSGHQGIGPTRASGPAGQERVEEDSSAV